MISRFTDQFLLYITEIFSDYFVQANRDALANRQRSCCTSSRVSTEMGDLSQY